MANGDESMTYFYWSWNSPRVKSYAAPNQAASVLQFAEEK
jgi:hypothetical protein